MKLAFCIPHFGVRSAASMSWAGSCITSGLVERGHDVAVLANELPLPEFPLHPKVTFIRLERPKRLADIPVLRRLLLALEVDVCVCIPAWSVQVYWALAVHDTAIKLCVSERNPPEQMEEVLWNRNERLAFMAMADAIHLLDESFKDSLPPKTRRRACSIPNMVDIAKFSSASADVARSGSTRKSVVIVSRLDELQKQISLAIEAFALLPPSCADWTLDIYGKGASRERYERLIEELRLQNRVFLRGHCDDMPKVYASAQISAIPSKYEGFCLSMVEAMAHALPTVAFKGCPGISHSALDNITALLAPEMTAQSFAENLTKLMLDADLRQRLGRRAQEHVKQFAPEKIIPLWEAMLQQCVQAERDPTRYTQADVDLLRAVAENPKRAVAASLRGRLRMPPTGLKETPHA